MWSNLAENRKHHPPTDYIIDKDETVFYGNDTISDETLDYQNSAWSDKYCLLEFVIYDLNDKV